MHKYGANSGDGQTANIPALVVTLKLKDVPASMVSLEGKKMSLCCHWKEKCHRVSLKRTVWHLSQWYGGEELEVGLCGVHGTKGL